MEIVKQVLLQYTDVVDNNNKWYRITLYDNDKVMGEYGRVGQECATPKIYEGGIGKFNSIMRSKTRHGRKHQYKIVDTSGGEIKVTVAPEDKTPSTSFIRTIYESSGKTIKSWYDGDINQLSARQIQSGEGTLRMIQRSLGSASAHRMNAMLSEYYTTIPHKLGRNIRDIASEWDAEKVNDEFDYLQDLMDAINTNVGHADMTIGDMVKSLGITVATASDFELGAMRKLIMGSMSGTHGVSLTVRNVFSVSNKNTAFRYNDCPISKPVLLFHGSRTPNFVGLLSRGFLVKPSGVPTTGSMFGNGIYFADVSTKSTQYCTRDGRWPMYLIIAEVKTGRKYKARDCMNVNQAPNGYDSVMGVAGETRSFGYNTLLHNEFIVYHPRQTDIRFVAEVTAYRR